jgi:Uma2 family endonuclease
MPVVPWYIASMAETASVDQLLGPRVTLDEWIALPEDVPGEFVDGRLVEEEGPDYRHEVLVAWLARVLGNWAETAGAIVGASDTRFSLSATRGRKADLTVYLAGRRPPACGAIAVPPDIAVEIVSSSPRDQRRDRVEKLEEYARFGIRFYWVIDPQPRKVEICERGAAGLYVCRVETGQGSLADVPGCPGLMLDLDAMWKKIDALEDA